MKEELLQIPATIKYIKTMADKSLRLSVDTQELNPEDKTKIFSSHDILGWFMFTKIEMEGNIEIPEYKKVEKDEKSPSERLRNVFYRLWKDNEAELKQKHGVFNNYYRDRMEVVIDHFKSKMMNF